MSLHKPTYTAHGRTRQKLMNEINVTPFVDVMTVLLIVFMITAPMLAVGVQVDLPKTESSPIADSDNQPIEIALDKKGRIFVGESLVTDGNIRAFLLEASKNNFEARVYVRDQRAHRPALIALWPMAK